MNKSTAPVLQKFQEFREEGHTAAIARKLALVWAVQSGYCKPKTNGRRTTYFFPGGMCPKWSGCKEMQQTIIKGIPTARADHFINKAHRKETAFTSEKRLLFIDQYTGTIKSLLTVRLYWTGRRWTCCAWLNSGIIGMDNSSDGSGWGDYEHEAVKSALTDAGFKFSRPYCGDDLNNILLSIAEFYRLNKPYINTSNG